jgi:selenoprotein W-related protein
VSLVQELLREFEPQINSLTLLPSGGGVFEVTVDGELIYSKKATGRHAESGEVVRLIKERKR